MCPSVQKLLFIVQDVWQWFVIIYVQKIGIEKQENRNGLTGCLEWNALVISDIAPGDRNEQGGIFRMYTSE